MAAAIEMLQAEKFAKMIAFLKSPACQRVRTNNHVERDNRKLRYQEKARYKWRKRRTIVRFVVLLWTGAGSVSVRVRNRCQEGVCNPGPATGKDRKEIVKGYMSRL